MSLATIQPKFDVCQKVKGNFDDEDIFFGDGYGIIREIIIRVSCVGVHIEYQVAFVKGGIVSREFRLDEENLENF